MEVVHCMKKYINSVGQVVRASDNAIDKAIVFLGETQLVHQLQKLLVQPVNGLDEAVNEAQANVPSSDANVAFYAAKDTTVEKCYNLLPRRCANASIATSVEIWRCN
jgi:hypothetical protein